MPDVTAPARRADARRNADRILQAAIECLAADPTASAGAIAKVAGVGRVTLYAHFETRDKLVEAALTTALAQGDLELRDVQLPSAPAEALRALIAASWQQIARTGSLIQAAQASLNPGRVTELHNQHRARVRGLIDAGRVDGSFRTDLPAEWLVSVLEHILHGAGGDVADGRLAAGDAAGLVTETVLAAYRPPTA